MKLKPNWALGAGQKWVLNVEFTGVGQVAVAAHLDGLLIVVFGEALAWFSGSEDVKDCRGRRAQVPMNG